MTEREKVIASLKYFSPLNDLNIDWDKCDLDSLVMLDAVRGKIGMPIYVTSNYRTPQESQIVGGFAGDEHNQIPCECFDLRCKTPNGKWDSAKAYLLIPALISVGFTRIGINPKNCSVHAGRSKDFPQNVLFME